MKIFIISSLIISSVYSASIHIEPDDTCVLSELPPDPETQCCGVDSISRNKIVGGKSALVNQYPWMALLEYKLLDDDSDQRYTLCDGFLISGRYVVTAAHCLAYKTVKLVSVILGAHENIFDSSNYMKQKKNYTSFRTAVRIDVDKVITHTDYDPENLWHDIALLRLKSLAKFTDSVRPICLPDSDISKKPPKNLRFYSAGWGNMKQIKTKNNTYEGIDSFIKQHVDLPYKPIQECQKYGRKLTGELQICAGGDKGKDVCMGDSGGPLMYDNGGIYQAVGVVSYGSSEPCGEEGYPGVYTKVFAYKFWILRRIKFFSRKYL